MAPLLWLTIILQVCSVLSNFGSILEIHDPDLYLQTDNDGNITFQAAREGSIRLHSGRNGSVYFRDYDLHNFVKVMRGFPPFWGTPSAVGFVARYNGGDHVNITLNAKDPENDVLVYSVVAGDLPPGLVLDHEKGVIQGIAPDENAFYVITVRASDNHHKYADTVLRFETRDSDRCKEFHPCQNGGSCVDRNGFYECHCTGVYGGINCSLNCSDTAFGVDANHKLVPDAMMSAYGSNNSYAKDGRYNGAGWCGYNQTSWLQVDLGKTRRVYGVLMSGDATNFYTGTFMLKYSVDGTNFHMFSNSTTGENYKLSMKGLSGTTRFALEESFEARFVRFIPSSYGSSYGPCMKVELYGCDIYYLRSFY